MAFRSTAMRRFAAKMTEAERSEALREANSKMREYHMNRPSLETLKKRKSRKGRTGSSSEHTMQMALAASFVTVFLATPFLGRKIAQDEEWRKKYIPAAYDFTVRDWCR